MILYIILGLISVTFLTFNSGVFNKKIGKTGFSGFVMVGPGNGCQQIAAEDSASRVAKLCQSSINCKGMLVNDDGGAIPCANEVEEGDTTDKSSWTIVKNVENWLKKYIYYRNSPPEKKQIKTGGPLGVVEGYKYIGKKEACTGVGYDQNAERSFDMCKEDMRCVGIGITKEGKHVYCSNVPAGDGEMDFYQLSI